MLLKIALSFLLIFVRVPYEGFKLISTPPTVLTLQIIIDYAETKNWKHVVFFDCMQGKECRRSYTKSLYDCFWKKEIFVSLNTLTLESDLSEILKTKLHSVGVALLIDDIDLDQDDNLLRKVIARNKNARSSVFGEYTSWLVLSTKWNNTQIFDAMKEWPIGVDSDVTIATTNLSSDAILNVSSQSLIDFCEELRNYGRNYDYAMLDRSQNASAPVMTFLQGANDASKSIVIFYMVTLYKIQVDGNASLEKENWNTWSPRRGFAKRIYLRGHIRRNLGYGSVNIGFQTRGNEAQEKKKGHDAQSSQHEVSSEVLLELLNSFEIYLKLRGNITNFSNPGNIYEAEGNSELIHALTSGEIVLGVFLLDMDLNQQKSFGFSLPILHFKRNIYFKPPKVSNFGFMQNWRRGTLLSIAGTFILIVTLMELINFTTVYIHWKEDEEHLGLGEALIWCLSVMCMQGSPWLPRTRAGKVVLLAGLMFTLIMYNTYSGSVASLMSVKTDPITGVSDFDKYDYVIGSTKIDDSDIFLDTNLRYFYFRAMERNQVEVSEIHGLQKVSKNKFAFLASDIIARQIFFKDLRFQSCSINELPTNSTGTLALPIAVNSPFKKLINLSILRMWELGILRKMKLKMKPPLLECEVNAGEHRSAGLGDVYGPFSILAIGFAASLALFYFELCWARRRRELKTLVQGARRQLHFNNGSRLQASTFRRQGILLPREGHRG